MAAAIVNSAEVLVEDGEMEDDNNQLIDLVKHEHNQSSRPDTPEEYKVMDLQQIVQDMNNCVSQVKDVVELDATTCRLLLHHFKWDGAKLLESFFNSPDVSILFSRAQLAFPPAPNDLQNGDLEPPGAQQTCPICVQTYNSSSLTGLECGHLFCDECWNGYLSWKILDEGQAVIIRCPQHLCNSALSDQMAMTLIKTQRARDKYQHIITDSFVSHNPNLCWCPKPDCGHAIQVPYKEMREVVCTCDTHFCFNCGHDWHEPINCDLLKKWIKKCNDDSETTNWLVTNTKECPKCHVLIEKNGGCNHMKCRKCGHDFCWMCGNSNMNAHYQCNVYQENKDVSSSRAALDRYLFYSTRYETHRQSLALEHKLYACVSEWQNVMQREQGMSWVEVQYMNDSVNSLTACRRTLAYSYAFAFYLDKNNQTIIFEENQRDLETATEHLSGLLERDVTGQNARTLKTQILDKSRYVEQRRMKLLGHVIEGMDKDWFPYRAE